MQAQSCRGGEGEKAGTFLGGGCGIGLRKRRDEAENTNADSDFSTITS